MKLKIVEFEDPAAFVECVHPMLMEREAENNLPLGISGNFARGIPRPQGTLLCAIEGDDRPLAVATMTPPFELVLSRMSAEALSALADHLRSTVGELPGVVAPSETADEFARIWTDRAGGSFRLSVSLRIYQLDDVKAPPPVSGAMRPAGEDDRPLLLRWTQAFREEIGGPHSDLEAALNRRLEEKSMFIWEDGQAVSMAGWAGPTPNGVRINAVYTPTKFRRHGYATACVAALSQHLLDSGRKFCFLFTDLGNPTSNNIYQRIGYRPVCDWRNYRFLREGVSR